MTSVREITSEELLAAGPDLFVRHQIDPRVVERAWSYGAAVVVQGGSCTTSTRTWPSGPGG